MMNRKVLHLRLVEYDNYDMNVSNSKIVQFFHKTILPVQSSCLIHFPGHWTWLIMFWSQAIFFIKSIGQEKGSIVISKAWASLFPFLLAKDDVGGNNATIRLA